MANNWFDGIDDQEVVDFLVKIKIKIKERSNIEFDCRTDLNINYDILELQLEETPSMYAFWAMIFSESRHEVSKLDLEVKMRSGKATKYIIAEATKKGVKLTNNQVEELVKCDEKLVTLQVKKMQADKIAGKLYHIVEAIKMKSEHLRSLAGFKRQERRDTDTM